MQIDPGSKSYERFEYIDKSDEPGQHRTQAHKKSATSSFRPERMVRLIVGVVLFVICALIIWFFVRLVLYIIASFLIAYLLRPIVDRLQGWGVGKATAILLSFVIFLGAIGILVTSLIPFVTAQIGEVSQQLTEETINTWATSFEAELRTYIPFIQEGSVLESVQRISVTLFQKQEFAQFASSAFEVFTDIFYAIFVIPFVTFFFLRDAHIIRRAALGVVPNRYFEVTLSVIEKIETNLGRYLKGLLLQCTYVAIVASIFLSFTDLDHALLIGIFTGVANSIPYFGPIMGLIAGSLASITQTGDFSLVMGILIAMGLTQIADNLLFQPLIFSRAVRTHPLVIMFVVLIGAQLAGIIGMLIAIPLTTTVLVTVQQVLWSLRNYRILHVT